MSFIKLSVGLAAVGLTVLACGPSKSSSSSFPDKASAEDPGGGSHGPLGDPAAGGDESGGAGGFESCATKTAAAEAKPVYLVFMFDKSESMTIDGSPKWSSAKAASKAFFESADSKGVHASLSFFPDREQLYSCDAAAYRAPSVAMVSLPSPALGQSLDAQTPNGDTPTRVALGGAIAYAQDIAAAEAKDGKVAIVLVTDGLPDSICDDSSIGAVKELAATVAATIPTYVIGVGDELTNLHEIAMGGGTKRAFIVDTVTPQQIQQDFLSAINAIKQSALACDFEIPSPPEGEQLDRNQVNVVYQSGGGADTFAYNPSCDAGTGWRYDDPNAPKHIVLCDASCQSVKTNPGQIQVLFGCATRTVGVK